MPSETSPYSSEQVECYLQRIHYGDSTEQPRLLQLYDSVQNDPLGVLANLQKHHLCSIPWGNSALHYSQHHSISVHPEAIFEKLVVRRLDGYCLESTNLFYGILRALKYQVYTTAGRVSKQAAVGNGDRTGSYQELGHLLLIVTIEREKYMVDVGYGNNCATRPLPLKENVVAPQIAPAEMRLIRDTIPELTDKTQKLWIYQVRYNPQSNWIPNVCFSEAEFLPEDFAVLNFFTSKHPSSWFSQLFVCSLMVISHDKQEIQGQYILSGKEVKTRLYGHTTVLKTLENESDRVKALTRWFGMRFREDEVQGIRGLASQVK